jgi:sn-glycerol 3-phosphate transport system permease protein
VALLLAVMADRVIKGAAFYKTLLIWPYAVAPAVAGVVFLFMFAPSVGVVSYALVYLGVEWNHLLDDDHAMALIVLTAVWNQISYNFLFFLAGLQSIPKSLIEAAAIDGARPWRRFWTIVFPLLSPVTFFLLVINIVYAFFNTFGIVDTATQGGPGKSTSILVYRLYYDGFKALDLGGSAAQSVVLMIIVITLTVIQFRYVEKKVQY